MIPATDEDILRIDTIVNHASAEMIEDTYSVIESLLHRIAEKAGAEEAESQAATNRGDAEVYKDLFQSRRNMQIWEACVALNATLAVYRDDIPEDPSAARREIVRDSILLHAEFTSQMKKDIPDDQPNI